MSATPAGPDQDRVFADRLGRAVERGLITREQAAAILADDAVPADAVESGAGSVPAEGSAVPDQGPAQPTPTPDDAAATPAQPVVRGSLVAEALGYVGGVLVLIGAVTIALNFWGELGLAGRLAVLFGAAALMLITGIAVPARRLQVARRLRSVCWLVSVILFGAGVMLLAQDVFHLDRHTGVLTMGCAAIFAGVLWWCHRTVPLQAILVIALALTATSAVSLLPNGLEHLPGLAVWGFGVAWLLLAEGGVIMARRAGAVLGGGAAVIGSLFTIGANWGAVLSIGSAVALVAAGVGLRNLILLALGAVGILLSVPMVVGQYFPDMLVVSLALLGCGVLLVAGGIVMARRGRIRPSEPAGVAIGRIPAIGTAAGVAIATTIAVLLLGR